MVMKCDCCTKMCSDEDIYSATFSKFLQDKKNFVAGEEISIRGWEKITIFYSGDRMDFPSEGCISHDSDRCVQRVRVCACVCVARSWMCKREIRRHPSPSGFYINCGGITLSIVGSLGISSVCNISLIHTSLWTSPCRTIPSVPPPTHRWPCNILRPSF